MAVKSNGNGNRTSTLDVARDNVNPDSEASETEQVLAEARRELDGGRPDRAGEILSRSKIRSPWITNAMGVCQIRLGDGKGAVETFRGLVLKDGIHFREDLPPVFKLNFAAALLAAGNLDGFLSALGDVGKDEHPAARRYREAYRSWKSSLTFGQRMKAFFVGLPTPPAGLGATLGDV